MASSRGHYTTSEKYFAEWPFANNRTAMSHCNVKIMICPQPAVMAASQIFGVKAWYCSISCATLSTLVDTVILFVIMGVYCARAFWHTMDSCLVGFVELMTLCLHRLVFEICLCFLWLRRSSWRWGFGKGASNTWGLLPIVIGGVLPCEHPNPSTTEMAEHDKLNVMKIE